MTFSSGRESVEPTRSQLAAQTKADLISLGQSRSARVGEKVAIAALGAIPWVGGFLAVLAGLKTEEARLQASELLVRWIEGHEDQIKYLERDVTYLVRRIEMLGDEAIARAESDEYLGLVRKAFSAWDKADTEEKRQYYADLLANASGSLMCSDDLVRLFIAWIERYHESHFKILRYVYLNQGCTKYDIGVELFGEPLPQDNSAEGDLFRELFRELNMGGIVRQARESDEQGRFLRRPRAPRRRGPASPTIESSFEDTKPQVLSELGGQFIHYVMDKVVPRVGQPGGPAESE